MHLAALRGTTYGAAYYGSQEGYKCFGMAIDCHGPTKRKKYAPVRQDVLQLTRSAGVPPGQSLIRTWQQHIVRRRLEGRRCLRGETVESHHHLTNDGATGWLVMVKACRVLPDGRDSHSEEWKGLIGRHCARFVRRKGVLLSPGFHQTQAVTRLISIPRLAKLSVYKVIRILNLVHEDLREVKISCCDLTLHVYGGIRISACMLLPTDG